MKAVILAAGRGTRLGILTEDKPKPMVEIAGKPMVEYVIDGLKQAGITEFVLIVKYLSEVLENYFKDGSDSGVNIKYVEQGDKYGTGAALLCAEELCSGESVFMTYADIICSYDTYLNAINIKSTENNIITVNWVDDPYKGGCVVLDENEQVKNIIEKPEKGSSPSNWNSSGAFVFENKIFDYLRHLNPSARGEYELPDAINNMIKDECCYKPNYVKGLWRDLGTVEDIKAVENMFISGVRL